MGIAGMILCIVGLVFSAFPVFGAFIVIPLVGAGLPLSGVAFYQSRESGTYYGIPVAIAGWVTGVAAIVSSSWLGMWGLLWAATAFFDWAP